MQLCDYKSVKMQGSLTIANFREAAEHVLVYDCSSKMSFINIRNWLKMLKNHAGIDEGGILLAKEYKMKFFEIPIEDSVCVTISMSITFIREISVLALSKIIKGGANLEEAFDNIAREALAHAPTKYIIAS
eukprot:TRINITY_DN14327_c0_g1_i4.p1 TRINITY_DN14327_c0_g1~~TRINITY_DN14327_c0_g1_i4.p1  ORF type:complete len:131 (+),score=5.33 TRINITY_DN14327_c0_g1_i4:179-571(+)